MTSGDTSLPAEVNGCFRNPSSALEFGFCLVGVKIEIEVAVACQNEDAIERGPDPIVDNDGTQDTAVISYESARRSPSSTA